jgi:hypothetical protein
LTEIGEAESTTAPNDSGPIIALIRIKFFENGFGFSAQRAVGVEVALRA